ncbi:MAG: hypothetical protein ABFD81_10270 [Syntrophaceae bacterium]
MKKDDHVTQEDLIMAVIDKGGLTPEKQAHLAACQACRSEAERLGCDLASLGDLAKAVVPPMQTTIMLPEAKTLKPARPWGLRLAYGSALAAALVVLILTMPFFRVSPSGKMEALYQDMLSDARLMIEIDRMAKNPLPESWAAFDDEFDAGEDDDFMDGIAPGGEDFS